MRKTVLAATALAVSSLALTPLSPVLAHGKNNNVSKIGEKGDPAKASRTVHINMTDNRFQLGDISVEANETVRFVVKNAGEFVHEFNIGNAKMHSAHQKEMLVMMEMGVLEADRINHDMMGHGSKNSMKHDDPNSVLLEPGKTGEVVWTFPVAGQLQMACNVPGHYEDGMVGNLVIKSENSS